MQLQERREALPLQAEHPAELEERLGDWRLLCYGRGGCARRLWRHAGGASALAPFASTSRAEYARQVDAAGYGEGVIFSSLGPRSWQLVRGAAWTEHLPGHQPWHATALVDLARERWG